MKANLKARLHNNLCRSYNGECVDCPCCKMACCNKPGRELTDEEINEGFEVMQEFMLGEHKR